ncbi:MAG: hypothetical protein LIO86_12120 [Lachnospiraceae bacterium]|nr:hypothetical protein [Lachnospiraceae bacterium]
MSDITGNILSNDWIGVMFCCKKCGKYFFRYVLRDEYYFHYWDEDYKKNRPCAVCQFRDVRDWGRNVKRKLRG